MCEKKKDAHTLMGATVGLWVQGGYFYVHPSPGIRIIVLNTILYSLRATHSSEDDPCGQFDWLEVQPRPHLMPVACTHMPCLKAD